MSTSRKWRPDYTHSVQRPTVGDLMPYDHKAWRVIEVRDIPEGDWTDEERTQLTSRTPEYQVKNRPFVVTVRPIRITGNDPRARDHDRMLGYPRNSYGHIWDVYRDEHYPICNLCGEPTPCREQLAIRETQTAMVRMGNYEDPQRCPACKEVFTSRQKSITFSENLVSPLGPPVTFHWRRDCRWEAAEYERTWAAADPKNRTIILSCPGRVTTHSDDTYECTTNDKCPGPVAFHSGGSICGCCPGKRDYRPEAHYRRRNTNTAMRSEGENHG